MPPLHTHTLDNIHNKNVVSPDKRASSSVAQWSVSPWIYFKGKGVILSFSPRPQRANCEYLTFSGTSCVGRGSIHLCYRTPGEARNLQPAIDSSCGLAKVSKNKMLPILIILEAASSCLGLVKHLELN